MSEILSQVWWDEPEIPAIWQVEVRASFEPNGFRKTRQQTETPTSKTNKQFHFQSMSRKENILNVLQKLLYFTRMF